MKNTHVIPTWSSDLLRHCSMNVNRYKGLPPKLSAFPVIGKGEIVADYAAFIAANLGVAREELAALLKDEQRKRTSISEGMRWRNIVIEETSGTSGIPFNFAKTVSERAMASCEIWKMRRTIDPLVNSLNFYPFLHAPVGFTHEFHPSDTSPQNVVNLYTHLSARGTRWVHGAPEMLRQHAAALKALSHNSSMVRFFESSGLYLSTEAKSEIESLGITVVNQYGCREAWVIGYGIGSPSEFEVLTNNVLVEIIDGSGSAIDAHGVIGDIVVTVRFARLMPFVRYRTGDRGSWALGDVGRRLHLMDTEREPGAWRWGDWGSGSRFFRIMLSRVYMRTGYIPMRVLQIREMGNSNFAVITDNAQRRSELCETLERVCASDAPRPENNAFRFFPLVLDARELSQETEAKPTLFRPISGGGDSQFANYF